MYKFLGIHFSRWLILFWPFHYFMRLNIKPTEYNPEKIRELHGKSDVIYVLPWMYMIDALILNFALRALRLPRARTEALPNRFRHAALLGVRSRKGLVGQLDRKDYFSEQVAAILRKDKRIKSHGLVVQPVSIFWSRGAERTERNFVLKSLFPDDGSGNAIQKILLLILHRGQVNIHFGKPFELSPHAELETGTIGLHVQDDGESAVHLDELQAGKRIRRHLFIEFYRERTAALGPALYDLSTIAHRILTSPETVKLISTMDNAPKQRKRAYAYLEEIAANYNYTSILALEKVLDVVWTRIFKGVRVRNFEGVAQVAKSGQIVWMPCHRSHLDYMLLSYVLFKKGLVTPHIAAGVNLSFWPAGPILRRGGAFFIRRSFSGNKLYAHVFAQYVDFLMHNSFPVEFFHEGGRSRIGKLLSPKTGLTNICVASILRRKAENTYVIPVYFSYDKVMEDDSYARELAGAKKQRESLWQLLRSVRFLFSNYGSVDVSFGTPLHFGDLWQEHNGGVQLNAYGDPQLPSAAGSPALTRRLSQMPEEIDGRDARIQSFVRFLAKRVNQGVNAVASASGSSLLTSALIASVEPDLSEQKLTQRVSMLHWIMNRLAADLGWKIATATTVSSAENDAFVLSQNTSMNSSTDHVVSAPMLDNTNLEKIVREILETGISWSFVTWKKDDAGKRYFKNPEKEMNLWWYRGTIFHIMAVVGIVSTIVSDPVADDLTLSRIESRVSALRSIWEEELYWPDSTSTATLTLAGLNVLMNLGVLKDAGTHSYEVARDEASTETLKFLSDLVRPERELYGIQIAAALSLVATRGRFSRDEVVRRGGVIHLSAFLRGAASQPANISHVFGGRTFDALYKSGVFVPEDKQQLSVAFTEVVAVTNFFELNNWKEFLP